MAFEALLAFTGAVLSGGLALFVLLADPRLFIHWVFASGMCALVLAQICAGMGVQAVLPVDIVRWEYLRLLCAACMPGTWLLFSVHFARANSRDIAAQWRWVILASFVLPFVLVITGQHALFTARLRFDTAFGWVLPLGWTGYGFSLSSLLISVVILMHFERTLRASTGSLRWQIKFMLLGLGSLFAAQIYTDSQVLLFASTTRRLNVFTSWAVIVANAFMIGSFMRHRFLSVDIYLSRRGLHNSLTVLLVGGYLFTVGALAKVLTYFGWGESLPFEMFFVFMAAVALAVVLLSEQLRQKLKLFINRHFYRARYDYRQKWTTFTERTTSVVDVQDLCAVVVKMISETFGVPAVTIWLCDEDAPEVLSMGGSTVFSRTERDVLGEHKATGVDFVQFMREQRLPIDLERRSNSKAQALKATYADYFRKAQSRYCVSLVAGQQLLGVMTLNNRLTRDPFSPEDLDLLKTFADQAAASLLSLRLSQRLLKAKEMEAFQTLSAFFVHDLKNLAAKLSLLLQNVPIHYDNPAFRQDLLRVISGSVAKMTAMCSRVSLLTKKLDLHPTLADLNELVQHTLTDVQDLVKVPLLQELHPVPKLLLDPEHLQKVVINLLLNASEAVNDRGEIHITTDTIDGWVVLAVRDNGCGIPKAFIERSLFHPFQTTKSQGLGIGLFHSKMIVEAHHGRIEVESEEGKGSTFKVFLPLARDQRAPHVLLKPNHSSHHEALGNTEIQKLCIIPSCLS
jgi:putative PEP-CTERM system histidine kinase